jgi:membrane-bound ClpP family serine protease
MHFLEFILAVILAPFWIPLLLMAVGFVILFGALLLVCLLVVLFFILCFVLGVLKTLYNIHNELVSTRQMILKEIGDNMSWWGIARLILNQYRKKVREARELRRQKAQEEVFDD